MSKRTYLQKPMTANVILFGNSNSGKTTALKILYLMLGGSNPTDLKKSPNINRCKLIYNGLLVGFAWGGDSLSIVEENVEFFTNELCTIAFSPAHVGAPTTMPMNYFIEKNVQNQNMENIVWKLMKAKHKKKSYAFKNDVERLNVNVWKREFPESYEIARKMKSLLDSGFFGN